MRFVTLIILITTFTLLACSDRSGDRNTGTDGSGTANNDDPVVGQDPQPGGGEPGNNLALLVGINKYANLGPDLQLGGCVNDVNVMKNLMQDVFSFPAGNITVLTDEQATRANILQAFRDLIGTAGKTSQVLFYYSGHGSRVPDDNLDEADGLDESIVAHDSRGNNVPDIRDDELEALLSDLTGRCDNVTIIMDCCNSGSGFRSAEATSNSAKPRLAPTLGTAKSVPNASGNDGRSGFLPPNKNYVLISGCRDSQYSYEENGSGMLTSALNTYVRKDPNITYRGLMYNVAAKVATQSSDKQHPQLEGSRRDATLFGNLGKVDKFVEVDKLAASGNLILKAGKAHGVTVGSVYEIYPPGTTNRDNNHSKLATAEVTTVQAFQAAAKITQKIADVPANSSAFEIAHNYGDLQMRVFFDLASDPALKSKVAAALQRYSQREDLVHGVQPGEPYEIRVFHKDNKLQMERPDQFILTSVANNDPDKLLEILTKEARRLNVISLENGNSGLRTRFKVDRWENLTEDDFGARSLGKKLPLERDENDMLVLDEGNIIQMTFTNRSGKPINVYLLDIATDGGVYLRFPAEGGQDSPLAPGDSIKSFHMKITPPGGINILKVIATTEPTDFFALTQSGFRSVPKDKSPLEQMLNMAWGGSRNAEVIKPRAISDWTTEQLTFRIR